MATIILPAHNEASVIGATLSSLLPQLAPDDQVIVVSNGSTDDTDLVSRRFVPQVTIISTPVASKANALNVGDENAVSFPRIYLDADVRLAPGSLARMKSAFASGHWQAASPEPLMDFSGSSYAVKAYYKIWLSLPYCKSGMIGAGAYALSEAGRSRFDRFPNLISDDGYVRALFKEDERGRIAGAHAIVRAPVNLHWLLKIKIRSRLGQMQLRQAFPELVSNERKSYGSASLGVLINPFNWPNALIYLYVAVVSRLGANRLLSQIDGYKWEKDTSSRGQPGA